MTGWGDGGTKYLNFSLWKKNGTIKEIAVYILSSVLNTQLYKANFGAQYTNVIVKI